MEDTRIRKFAQTMIHQSVGLKPGERILIEIHGNARALGRALIEEAYAAGGLPFFHLHDYELDGAVISGASESHMQQVAAYELDRMREMDAYIDVRAMDNVSVWNRIPTDRLAAYRKHYWGPLHLEERCSNTRWTVTRYPNDSMAQLAGMSTDEYEDFYFAACLLDYERMRKAAEPLIELIERTDRVRILGPDTDLSFSIAGMRARACCGGSNLPDGEVYTAPVRDSVNGTIRYNAPSPCDGFVFSDVRFTFRDGKIIEAHANDDERLNRVLDTDEGARYIGEFALGINPIVTSPMQDILFDEKISGSFHFTPGNAYQNCDNGNRSAVHWDLVCIQTPPFGGGEIWFDDTLVRRNGLFVPEALLGLNPDHLLGK